MLRLLLAPFRRAPRRPLSTRRPGHSAPARPDLGMEAIDMRMVADANRRNDALERVTLMFSGRSGASFTQNAATRVDPLPDDETYAAEYHRRFNR